MLVKTAQIFNKEPLLKLETLNSPIEHREENLISFQRILHPNFSRYNPFQSQPSAVKDD